MKKIAIEVVLDEWMGKPTSEPIIDKDGYFHLLDSLYLKESIKVGDMIELILFADTKNEYLWPDHYKGYKSTNHSEVVRVIGIRNIKYNDDVWYGSSIKKTITDVSESTPGEYTSVKVEFLPEIRESKLENLGI